MVLRNLEKEERNLTVLDGLVRSNSTKVLGTQIKRRHRMHRDLWLRLKTVALPMRKVPAKILLGSQEPRSHLLTQRKRPNEVLANVALCSMVELLRAYG